MQLEQLEYFLTAARHEHVTNAAKECSISQPALSNAIARLENELGVPLFDRSGRNIRLNQFGAVFRDRIERGFHEIEQGYREVREMAGIETGSVSLAVDCPEMLVKLVCGFYEAHPTVYVRENRGNMSSLFRQLDNDRLDFVICEKSSNAGELEWQFLTKDQVILLVNRQHPLAERNAVYLRDLEGEKLVCPRPGVGLRDTLTLLMESEGLRPNIAFEGDDADTIEHLVEMGIGITAVSGVALRLNGGVKSKDLVSLPLVDEKCVREIGIYTKRNHFMSQAAMLFMEYVKEYFRAQ
jgi:DNA-binding transcriptional LysR family regulator